MSTREIPERLLVWALASMSFACLLGQFYGWWSMKAFACWVLLPCGALLAFLARPKYFPRSLSRGFDARGAILHGALGGLIAAVAYDVFRLPFVLAGFPLFKVFPEFGRLLLGSSAPGWAIQIAGWGYHFSNGAALGIMFAAMLPAKMTRAQFIVAGACWAMLVEAILLLTPYRDFFKILMPAATFLWLTASAHLVFGLCLGAFFGRRTSVRRV